jgi:DNA primase
MSDRRYSKEQLLKLIRILDLCDKYSISVENSLSGNFTHRCKCPFSTHKSGNERTKSLFIDSVNNNFYCFGCGASNNPIDFYMLMNCVDFSKAMLDLSSMIDPSIAPDVKEFEVKTSNMPILMEVASAFRTLYKKLGSNEEVWIENLSKAVDKRIDELDPYDVVGAQKILNKIKDYAVEKGVYI